MPRFCLVPIAGVLILTACNSMKQPSATNFTKAINQYLMRHGAACSVIGRQFPIDVPQAEQREQYGIRTKLATLEQAGLVHATDTTAVVHGLLDPLRGSIPAQAVTRYELTANGRRYFRQIPSALGQISVFCYGRKSVDSIVKWTEPATVGTSSQTEVTYTYKIIDPAGWAQRPDVQQAFSDTRSCFSTRYACAIAGLSQSALASFLMVRPSRSR